MNVLMLLVFIGAALVSLAIVLFLWTARSDTFTQGDRLALLPLGDERASIASSDATDATLAPKLEEPMTSAVDPTGTSLE